MISTLIIEDEKPARTRLKSFIDENDALYFAGEADTALNAIHLINEIKPQLIFLDVQLPDLSGLDILKVIDHKPLVVFTTAFDKYALSAFKHNAIDFLLKPFSGEQFDNAIEKVKNRLQLNPAISDEINKLLDKFHKQSNFILRIPAKVGEKIYIINVNDILFFQSKDKVVFAHILENYFIINYTLDELTLRLDTKHFFRIHRSTIVNLNFVNTIEPYGGGTYQMRLKDKNKTSLQISRGAAREIREKLGW